MVKTQQDKLKRQIITLIELSGRPVRTQYIVDRVVLPKHLILNDVLSELVAERRLSRSYTLLANGNPDCTYDLKF